MQIVVGPGGQGFWCLCSAEVFLRVEPDGYDVHFRSKSIEEWSYYAVGCSTQDVKLLLSSTPTTRHHLYRQYRAALKLKSYYERVVTQQQDLCSGVELVRSLSTPESDEGSVVLVTDFDEQKALLEALKGTIDSPVALDLEWTYGKVDSSANGRLIGINISYESNNYYFPILGKDYNTESRTGHLLKCLWRSVSKCVTVWHNAKADIGQFYKEDPLLLTGAPLHDTILMAYVAGEASLGLKDLSETLLGRKSVPLPADLELQPIEVAGRYGASGDTRNTLNLYHLLKKRLEDTSQWDIYNNIERPLVPLIASMERYGIPLDMEEVQRLRDEYNSDEQTVRSQILSTTGLDFGDDEGQRQYLSHNGFHSPSLDKRVLSKIAAGGAEWVRPLLDYRELRTLRRNFLDKHLSDYNNLLPDRKLGSSTYSIYPTFNQAGRDTESGSWKSAPATGRLSSAGPNLQNQPRKIRSCFTAPIGCKLVSLDYSSIELRLAAAISEDPIMLKVFQQGGDLHEFMRQSIESKTGIDVGRPTAKNANFNLRYGGQADMLITVAAKQGAHLEYEVAKAIVDADHSTYVKYWEWFQKAVSRAVGDGYSSTLYGRRRYNADLRSNDQLKRGHAERAAANMIIQGTAADILKIAMNRLIPILKYFNAHLALQVHDELVFWVPEAVAERFYVAAKGTMESIQIPHLKLAVEGFVGNNWAEAH